MIVVRNGIESDWTEFLRMTRAFFDATAFGNVGFDEASMRKTFDHLLGNGERSILLMAENGSLCGMAAALIYPFYFNLQHLTAQELFWWVDPSARGTGAGIKLLKTLESESRNKGARSLSMIALSHIDGPQVEKLYRHYDYVKSEQSFLKVL